MVALPCKCALASPPQSMASPSSRDRIDAIQVTERSRPGRGCPYWSGQCNYQFNEEPPMKQPIALVAVTAVGLFTAGAAAAVSSASAATSGCSATYTVV